MRIESPFYLFIPQNTDLLNEYEGGWKITKATLIHSNGIVTGRDGLTINWTKNETKNYSTHTHTIR